MGITENESEADLCAYNRHCVFPHIFWITVRRDFSGASRHDGAKVLGIKASEIVTEQLRSQNGFIYH